MRLHYFMTSSFNMSLDGISDRNIENEKQKGGLDYEREKGD